MPLGLVEEVEVVAVVEEEQQTGSPGLCGGSRSRGRGPGRGHCVFVGAPPGYCERTLKARSTELILGTEKQSCVSEHEHRVDEERKHYESNMQLVYTD